MIGKLKGKIDSIAEDSLILDVCGVGYQVFVSTKNLHNLQGNEQVTLLIVSHIREDHIHLYGFINQDEKQMFSVLQSVSGIGPRMALNILSYLTPENIITAVNNQDKVLFKNISGVGARLAERIIIELKGKAVVTSSSNNLRQSGSSDMNITSDAITALVNLGINRADAQASVLGTIAANPGASIDEIIRAALKSR